MGGRKGERADKRMAKREGDRERNRIEREKRMAKREGDRERNRIEREKRNSLKKVIKTIGSKQSRLFVVKSIV